MTTSARNLSVLTGIITHAHRCESTVRVRVMKQTWNKKLRKFFSHPIGFLADDHAKACVAGDVVRVACGHLRTSSTKRHVVDAIVAPARTGEVRTEPEGVHGWLVRQNERRNLKWARKGGAEKMVKTEKAVLIGAAEQWHRAQVNKELAEQRVLAYRKVAADRKREWELLSDEERAVANIEKKAAAARKAATMESKRAWLALPEKERAAKDARKQARIEAWKALSEEEREARKQAWDAMSEEEKEAKRAAERVEESEAEKSTRCEIEKETVV